MQQVISVGFIPCKWGIKMDWNLFKQHTQIYDIWYMYNMLFSSESSCLLNGCELECFANSYSCLSLVSFSKSRVCMWVHKYNYHMMNIILYFQVEIV